MKELNHCTICPRRCGVDRAQTVGFCRSGVLPIVNLATRHRGEEPVISGTRGSGTIFFTNCNLHCIYCQNYRISQQGLGREISIEDLAHLMISLQADGVHNINLVTPTHFTPQIRAAILQAKDLGLTIPIVWNSNGYELPETLATIEGLVDIYLPDFRYSNTNAAARFSNAPDYPEVVHAALLEMHRQVGRLRLDDNGLAERGLLVRLLVLPEDVNDIGVSLQWIADYLGQDTCISLMAQYYPTYRAAEYPPLDRPLLPVEYRYAVDLLENLQLDNGFVQELKVSPEWTPDFK